MEFYDWNNSTSKKTIEKMFNKKVEDIENIEEYKLAINSLMNEGNDEFYKLLYYVCLFFFSCF